MQQPPRWGGRGASRVARLGLLVVLLVAVVVVAVVTVRATLLGAVDRVPVDAAGARERLADDRSGPRVVDRGSPVGPAPSTATPGEPPPTEGGPSDLGVTGDDRAAGDDGATGDAVVPGRGAAGGVADRGQRAFLVVGSDARAGLAGSRADVIIVGLVPGDGAAPVLFSLPRDLWLDDPCRGGQQRINAAFNGCPGLASGFELLQIVVEDFTGIEVDHVAAFDFAGFSSVIDTLGGVEICVDHPVRDSRFDLPAGCTLADGEQALGWVRSRRTQELVDGRWRTMPGVSDLTRNERQQDLLVQIARRARSQATLAELYAVAQQLGDSVTLGPGFGLLESARIAWELRSSLDEARRFSIPVAPRTTAAGAQVLVPTEPFAVTYAREVGRPLPGP